MLLISAVGHGHIFMRASGENRNWPIRRLVTNALIMTEHDNLSQTLFIFGLIKYVQLTLLHCLIVSEFRRYSPLRVRSHVVEKFDRPLKLSVSIFSSNMNVDENGKYIFRIYDII